MYVEYLFIMFPINPDRTIIIAIYWHISENILDIKKIDVRAAVFNYLYCII